MPEHYTEGISRRSFLTRSLAGAAFTALPAWFARESEAAESQRKAAPPKRFGPNDRINVGVIGPGGSKGGYRQGLNDTRNIASKRGVKVIAVCDVDAAHRDEAAAIFGPGTKKYHDFRDLLANKSIDAVVIGTPDHWHAVIAGAAMKAGKDVYCEKPLTLTIDEGKQLVKTWRQTRRVFQTGSQQRSDARFRLACQLVRNGRLGRVRQVIAHIPNAPTGGPFPAAVVPAGFDWEMWQGPARRTEYVPERTHGTFRWWLEYSGGMMTDWGAHHNDIAQWGLGMDRSGPVAVEAYGKRDVGKNSYNVFHDFDVSYYYPNNVTLLTTTKGENGVEFHGDNGWIFVNRATIRASDPALIDEPLPANADKLYVSTDHHGNFVDCIRTRRQPICDAEIGHRSVTVCHLGNLCMQLGGRRLEWDPVTEEFKNDGEANELLARPMYGNWKL